LCPTIHLIFYWLIPENAERGALGIIGEHGKDTKRCFERFLEKKGWNHWSGRARAFPFIENDPCEKRVGSQSDVYACVAAALFTGSISINGNARALPLQWFHSLFSQENVRSSVSYLAMFSNNPSAPRSAFSGISQ